VTGEQVTVREWVEERNRTMTAEFKAHREETRANMAEVAREIMREGRQTAVNIGLGLAGMMAVVGIGLAGLIVAYGG